jgi:hypothetical protein
MDTTQTTDRILARLCGPLQVSEDRCLSENRLVLVTAEYLEAHAEWNIFDTAPEAIEYAKTTGAGEPVAID